MGRGRIGRLCETRDSWAGVAAVESAGRGVHGPEDGGREDGSRATAVPPHRPCSAAPISWLLWRGIRAPSRCGAHSAACARSTGTPPPASHFSGPRPPCGHRLRPARAAGSILACAVTSARGCRCLALGPMIAAHAGRELEVHRRHHGAESGPHHCARPTRRTWTSSSSSSSSLARSHCAQRRRRVLLERGADDARTEDEGR